ncbi:MAG TPA: hypothetical protein VII58_06015 [Acidobacteriaceae bacterium]
MELEMKDELSITVDRLAAAATLLEQAAERLAQDAEARIGRIVATVESQREAELETKLAAAEAKIADLQARAAGAEIMGRKTLPASMTTLLAKQGVTLDSIEAGAVDAALASLSIEQRIAVKSQLLRAGLLG